MGTFDQIVDSYMKISNKMPKLTFRKVLISAIISVLLLLIGVQIEETINTIS